MEKTQEDPFYLSTSPMSTELASQPASRQASNQPTKRRAARLNLAIICLVMSTQRR